MSRRSIDGPGTGRKIGGFIVLGMSLWLAERLLRRPETLARGPRHSAST